jgi:hypothetical protein
MYATVNGWTDRHWQTAKLQSEGIDLWSWRPWNWIQRWNEQLSLRTVGPEEQAQVMIPWVTRDGLVQLVPSDSEVIIPENPNFLVMFLMRWGLRFAWTRGLEPVQKELLETWEAFHEWIVKRVDPAVKPYSGFAFLPNYPNSDTGVWVLDPDYFYPEERNVSEHIEKPIGIRVPLLEGLRYLVRDGDSRILAMTFAGGEWTREQAAKFWTVYGKAIAPDWKENTLGDIVRAVREFPSATWYSPALYKRYNAIMSDHFKALAAM